MLRFPPNLPALSPIEIILEIIKQMLVFFPQKDMNYLKIALKWESIPKKISWEFHQTFSISMGSMYKI